MKIVILEDDTAQARQVNDYLLRYQQEHTEFQYTAKTYNSGRPLLEAYQPDTDLLLPIFAEGAYTELFMNAADGWKPVMK